MNVPFYTIINILLCTSTLLPLIPNSSGLSEGKDPCPAETSKSQRPTMRINISDSRGKRHNIPLVGVENVDSHRIATCTKAPGRLVCKSGRYNYVINNGNFEIPAETLEKFVSTLYQKAKNKEDDFAVSLVTPEKESVPSVSQIYPPLPVFSKEDIECGDELQPVTIECELTDAKTLREINPDYQPKPNERVFKCITKRMGNRKRNPLHIIQQDQEVNIIGGNEHSLRNGIEETGRKMSPSLHNKWKLYEPFWIKTSSLQARPALTDLSPTPRDFEKKIGSDSMFYKPDVEDDSVENEKYIGTWFHREYPRPRVRDYKHTCADPNKGGWCPPLRSTTCLVRQCTFSSTLHPTFFTEDPDDGADKVHRFRKRMSYKFRSPLIEFIMPYGLKIFTKPEAVRSTGCPSTTVHVCSSTVHVCSRSTAHVCTSTPAHVCTSTPARVCSCSTTVHVCSVNGEKSKSEPEESSTLPIESDNEMTTSFEDEYNDSCVEESECKCNHHHRHHHQTEAVKNECGNGHKHIIHKEGCECQEVQNLDNKAKNSHPKEPTLHKPPGCTCKCDLYFCCGTKGPKCTTKHPCSRRTTCCTIITQRICIGLQEEHATSEPAMDALQSFFKSENQIERPKYSK